MASYFDSGFSVREPAWHGQGLVLDDYPTDWADARKKAGLTWEPVERQAYDLRPLSEFEVCVYCGVALGFEHGEDCLSEHSTVWGSDCIPAGAVRTATGLFVPLPEHKLIARDDTGLVLGVRSDEYSVIYHGEEHAQNNKGASMEEIIDAFRNADGSVKFETAGAAREGRAVWALLYLDEPYTVPGDRTETIPFVAVLNHHGMGGSATVTRTQVRVVCWNTFQMALAEGEKTGMSFRFTHTGDVASRIDDAKDALAGLRVEARQYQEMAAELMDLNMDDSKVAAFLSEFLPSPRENGEHCTDRVQANVDKARGMFKHIYLDSVTCEGIRGTGWGVLQASTEYLDHARAYRTRDSYLGRSILRAEPIKGKALNLIRSLA